MDQSVRLDILNALKRRNALETKPFEALFAVQARISEQNLQLKSDNTSLHFINDKLKEENTILKAKVSNTEQPSSIHSNEQYLELQRKLLSLQEELTELHK